jgi:type II protein arginine methyltransferase
MWRKTDDRKVWYEWFVDVYISSNPDATRISHVPTQGNQTGRTPPPVTPAQPRGTRIRIGGSDLHSSEKEACLM